MTDKTAGLSVEDIRWRLRNSLDNVMSTQDHRDLETLCILARRALTTDAKWQPISSAPKDGTPLLLITSEQNDDPSIFVGSFEQGKWLDWWSGGDVAAEWNEPVTHWQPLPEPPTDASMRKDEDARREQSGRDVSGDPVPDCGDPSLADSPDGDLTPQAGEELQEAKRAFDVALENFKAVTPSPAAQEGGENLFRSPSYGYETRSDARLAQKASSGDQADDEAHDKTLSQMQAGPEPETASGRRRNELLGLPILRDGTPSHNVVASHDVEADALDYHLDEAASILNKAGYHDSARTCRKASDELRALSARVVELEKECLDRGLLIKTLARVPAQAEIKKLREYLGRAHEEAGELLVKNAKLRAENNAYRKAINPRAKGE